MCPPSSNQETTRAMEAWAARTWQHILGSSADNFSRWFESWAAQREAISSTRSRAGAPVPPLSSLVMTFAGPRSGNEPPEPVVGDR